MRHIRLTAICAALLFGLMGVATASAYTNSHLIDNSVFDKVESMSASAIQDWLAQKYPNGCLTNYQAPEPKTWYDYGSNVPASQVIVSAAHIWGINPQVILTTLQKEEGLVTGGGAYGCSDTAFKSAMGYDCPGPYNDQTQSCVQHQSNVGFSAQVSHGGWQLEFGRQRSEGDGNLAYDGDGDITYYGYMTAGCRPRKLGGAVSCYDGNITLQDGTKLYIENGATASLYSYTPYLQQFSPIFEQFFGVGSTSEASPPQPPPPPPPPPTGSNPVSPEPAPSVVLGQPSPVSSVTPKPVPKRSPCLAKKTRRARSLCESRRRKAALKACSKYRGAAKTRCVKIRLRP